MKKKPDIAVAFKVRDIRTGLYIASGGKFSKTGKTWSNIGHLKLALNSWSAIPPNWEIVVLVACKKTISCDMVVSTKFKKDDVLELLFEEFQQA